MLECFNMYNDETISAIKAIKVEFAKVNKNLGRDVKAVTKSFAKIGKQALKNQFIFKAVVKTAKAKNAELSIKGERLSQVNTNLVIE